MTKESLTVLISDRVVGCLNSHFYPGRDDINLYGTYTYRWYHFLPAYIYSKFPDISKVIQPSRAEYASAIASDTDFNELAALGRLFFTLHEKFRNKYKEEI